MAADLSAGAAAQAHIRVENVRKSYGANPVLAGLSFTVAPGEVLVLCGPSGCGKSTLLRCINGLEPIQAGAIHVGAIRVDGADAATLKRVRTETGLVFQNFNLFPHLRVVDNIALPPIKVKGVPKQQAEAEAMALLASVGIPEKARAYPYELSGGQRQRVAIARALAMKPSLMMFDEPTSALDPEMREEVLNVIRSVHEERGMTMIVVTHEIGFAKTVADRAMLIEAGQVVEAAPAREFFTAPVHERTRRFLRAIIND
jgi:ABC-type polar amino acid transport system ATPase subunit